MNRTIAALFLAFIATTSFFGQGYKKPPKEVLDVLNIPATPTASVSPARDKIAMLTPLRYPPISELAQPMLRLGGIRINPLTNAQHRQAYFVGLSIKNVADGKDSPVSLPAGVRLISPAWSADGKYIAAGNITPRGIELWVVEVASAKATLVKGVQVNTTLGGFSWMPDQRSLLVHTVPADRGPAPKYQDVTPESPAAQETAGRAGAIETVQDLLKSPNDEKLFEYYTTSQLAVVSVGGKTRNIGPAAIYDSADTSPDGRYILVSKVEKPFSYLFPYTRFPETVEVWDMEGKTVHVAAKTPLQDALPLGGVPTGPRSIAWIPTEGSTLMWAEALDGGNPRNKAPRRDEVKMLASPFSGGAVSLFKVEHRLQGRMFGEKPGVMFYYDYDRDRDRRRMFMISDYRDPKDFKVISDLSVNDRYNNPGQPVMKRLANGANAVIMDGDAIYMSGAGSSPEGDRPFLRRMTLSDLQTVEMFRSGTDSYETFVALLNDKGFSFITRKESLTSPPNLFRWTGRAAPVALTDYEDPAPQLRGIKKQLVKYKRADGVDLSFTLYLPPNHKEGERLPTVLWAYPLEFTDAATAGQVSGSTNRFTTIGGYSHLFFLLQGYAVLDETTMPIVGDPEKVNDTFIEQIVASAKAAIDKGVEMGVVDPERVGVGGHSYGAFMTMNLLAHSDLFRAGIARSGAYNRTLTPFGFQSERRSFWEAQSLYTRVSPFFYADKIKEPVLMVHGEADNNQGTFPIQSERMYSAIRGNGGTARLVMLPLESHGYTARESTEHTIYEQLAWFEKYVKNAKPRK